MNRAPIRAVLFDFAGTLWSDRALRDVHLTQLRFVADAAGVDVEDSALRAAYRHGMGVAARALAGRTSYLHRALFAAAFREMAAALGASIDEATASAAVDQQYRATTEHAVLRSDARATLEGLRARGLHIQIVSNIDDEQLQPMVRRLGLDALVDAWTSSEEAGSCKPDARIFAHALAKARCDAKDALFVGDTIAHDVVGPWAVGMTTAWLTADVKPEAVAGTSRGSRDRGARRGARARRREGAVNTQTFEMKDKVAVITGGSKGLGRAMALGFAAHGADVVVASRKLAPCEKVAGEVRALGRRALAVSCHVADWAQCAALVEATVAEFGRIDVLVNNAGIAPVPPNLLGVTEDLFDKTIAVNLKGPLRLLALAAEHMPRGSSVINISSKASTHPSPFTVVYAAAKAGLNALTKAAAQEYGARGIRVNAIVCGMFHTDSFHASVPTAEAQAGAQKLVTLGRIADADEIVGTALYLATDASSYLTGQCITLDGGGA